MPPNELPITWLEPWVAIEDEGERRGWESKLRHEMPEGHILFGVPVTAIGVNLDEVYEVLFALDDGRVAQVHLTRTREINPAFPWVRIFDSLAEWEELIMKPTHHGC